jgi:LacI family transcriptional regulator
MNKYNAVIGSRRRLVTIREVAREAGVAISTVSYALSGKASLSESTKQRVLEAVGKLGYRPRAPRQRSLGAGSAPVVALLLPGGPGGPALDYHYLAETLRGATEAAQDFGFLVTVLYEKVKNPAFDFSALCRSGKIKGMIVSTPKVHDEVVTGLMAEGFPVVLMQGHPSSAGMPSVGIDDEDGAFRATEHLVILGHTRIAMILPGPLEIRFSADRREGYRRALGTYGIPFDETLVADGELQEKAAEDAMERLLGLPDPPTAVFAGNDTQAIGAMKAARGRGLAVPSDLAVIGFDDTTAARQSVPPLTTIRFPDYRVASESTRMLIRKILRPEIAPDSILIPAELVIRESCGVYAAGGSAQARGDGASNDGAARTR